MDDAFAAVSLAASVAFADAEDSNLRVVRETSLLLDCRRAERESAKDIFGYVRRRRRQRLMTRERIPRSWMVVNWV